MTLRISITYPFIKQSGELNDEWYRYLLNISGIPQGVNNVGSSQLSLVFMKSPPVDLKTGLITREWHRGLIALAGVAQGASNRGGLPSIISLTHPMVDGNGCLTREWYYWILSLFNQLQLFSLDNR